MPLSVEVGIPSHTHGDKEASHFVYKLRKPDFRPWRMRVPRRQDDEKIRGLVLERSFFGCCSWQEALDAIGDWREP